MANSKGDPRVLFVMNLVLSAVFASAVIWGLEYLGVLAFSVGRVAVATAALMVLTYLMIR